jgi:hypothetical protein
MERVKFGVGDKYIFRFAMEEKFKEMTIEEDRGGEDCERRSRKELKEVQEKNEQRGTLLLRALTASQKCCSLVVNGQFHKVGVKVARNYH